MTLVGSSQDLTGAAIVTRQNAARHRLLLAASSDVYGRAKQVLAIQMILTIGGAVVASIVSANWPGTKSWTVLYAVGVSLLDAFALERYQAQYRKLGAQIQELFDCELFGVPWNPLTAGKPPMPEDLAHHGQEFLSKHPNAVHLTDWYPTEISVLPLNYAALVCQRSNCWWDERLRRRYLIGLVALLALTAGGVTVYSLARELTLEQFFLAVLAPLWPALVWGIRECFKQSDAAESAGKLRAQVEELWSQCLETPLEVANLQQRLRGVQTEVYRGRISRPLVFNWVNSLLRSKHQALMQSGAIAMAERLAKKNHS